MKGWNEANKYIGGGHEAFPSITQGRASSYSSVRGENSSLLNSPTSYSSGSNQR